MSNQERKEAEAFEVYNHLRRVLRHESSYTFEFIERNYFISRDRMYKIMQTPPTIQVLDSEASLVLKNVRDRVGVVI